MAAINPIAQQQQGRGNAPIVVGGTGAGGGGIPTVGGGGGDAASMERTMALMKMMQDPQMQAALAKSAAGYKSMLGGSGKTSATASGDYGSTPYMT